jgi:UDP-3-O-acyl N-acetylglucosamine deacetylase
LRVVDCTEGIAGAYCSKLLTDLGADVVHGAPIGDDPLFVYLRTSQRHARDLAPWLGAADVVIVGEPGSAPAESDPLVTISITPLGHGGPDDGVELTEEVLQARDRSDAERHFAAPPALPLLQTGTEPQRTIRQGTVVYGLGLHSGQRTGMVLQPLPPDSGIHFITLPTGLEIPAHVAAVADTDYATTLSAGGENIRTVEHLLSALHARGVGNLLIKVHGEIPVLDGSALEFCKVLDAIGVADQDVLRREVVIDRPYTVANGSGDKILTLEPADAFSVSYLLRYPPPLGEQYYEFSLGSFAGYQKEIAPARTFGFLKDLKMMNELGLGSGGRLDNFILVGEDEVLNTELRFPDEFVRHKILDIIGDLYLLGYPIRGKVTARLTGHRDNIALLRKILTENREVLSS